jgi:hypothetical protein
MVLAGQIHRICNHFARFRFKTRSLQSHYTWAAEEPCATCLVCISCQHRLLHARVPQARSIRPRPRYLNGNIRSCSQGASSHYFLALCSLSRGYSQKKTQQACAKSFSLTPLFLSLKKDRGMPNVHFARHLRLGSIQKSVLAQNLAFSLPRTMTAEV